MQTLVCHAWKDCWKFVIYGDTKIPASEGELFELILGEPLFAIISFG